MLNPKILLTLKKKTGRAEKTIRNNIYLLRRDYSSLPVNSVAQIYARQNNTSILKMLTSEEKKALPPLSFIRPVTIKQKKRDQFNVKSVKEYIKYDTTDHFVKGHIDEVNRCCTCGCYTAAYILCRKIVENLLTAIIRKKYDQRKLENIDLHFDTTRGRTRDFSEIIFNLRPRIKDFGQHSKLLDRILTKSAKFKDDANDKTHSLYHLVKKSEFEDTDIPEILYMLQQYFVYKSFITTTFNLVRRFLNEIIFHK